MTRRLGLSFVLTAALGGSMLVGASARGEGESAPRLPDGVVARVLGTDLTHDAFGVTLVQHSLRELRENHHGPRAVLEQMIEELLVVTRCRELGIDVREADLRAKEEDLNRQVRQASGGRQRLSDVIAEQGKTVAEFRAGLLHEMRKDRLVNHRLGGTLPDDEHQRLNQIKVVIAKLVSEADVKYGIPVKEDLDPETLEPNVVATVNGAPITRVEFGRQLTFRLPSHEVREALARECQVGIMVKRGTSIDDPTLLAEVEHLRNLWVVERTIQREVEWESVEFPDRFRAIFKVPVEEITSSRYLRGLFGLVRQLRGEVEEKDLRANYDDGLRGRYGPHIVAMDVKIGFEQGRNPFRGSEASRDRREALDLGRRVYEDALRGTPFERIVSEIRNRHDSTYTASRIRIYDSPADALLWRTVNELKDGAVSAPFDTLAEVHVLRRERQAPGKSYEALRELLVDYEARQKAMTWLAEQIADPEVVRMRWPLTP